MKFRISVEEIRVVTLVVEAKDADELDEKWEDLFILAPPDSIEQDDCTERHLTQAEEI